MKFTFRSFGPLFLACASFVTAAQANTIVVDVYGGGSYTDIQSAVDAAQPGDVVLVMAGYYSGFTLAKPISVIGVGSAYLLSATLTIQNITAGQRAVIVNLMMNRIIATNCAGHVIVVDSRVRGVHRCRSARTSASTVTRFPAASP